MSDNLSVNTLRSLLQSCRDKAFASETLTKARNELDALSSQPPKDLPLLGEIAGAFMNLLDQLIDETIEADDSTSELFDDAIEVLDGLDNGTKPTDKTDYELSGLIDAIDIEASGGFDDDESDLDALGTVPLDNSNVQARVANVLRRFRSQLTALEHKAAEGSINEAEFLTAVTRLQDLGRALSHSLDDYTSSDIAALELMLKFEFSTTSVTNHMRHAETWSSPIAQKVVSLAKTLTLGQSNDPDKVELTQAGQRVEISMMLGGETLDSESLHDIAKSLGVQNPNRLYDEQLWQFALADPTQSDTTSDESNGTVVANLHALHSTLVIEPWEGKVRVVLSVPKRLQLKHVTVFRLRGELYAIDNEWVVDVTAKSRLHSESFDPTLLLKNKTYPLIHASLDSSSAVNPSLVLHGDRCDFALMVDSVDEMPGEVITSVDSSIDQLYGCIRLLDGRVVVLVQASDFESGNSPTRHQEQRIQPYVISLDETIPKSWYHSNPIEIRTGQRERETISMMQEQRPIAFIAPHTGFNKSSMLPSYIDKENIPLLHHRVKTEDANSQPEEYNHTCFDSPAELRESIRALLPTD